MSRKKKQLAKKRLQNKNLNIRRQLRNQIMEQMKFIGKDKGKGQNDKYKEIHSLQSAENHLKRVSVFAKYLKTKGVANISDIDRKVIDEYIESRIKHDQVGAKTIQADVLTINHLFMSNGMLKEPLSKTGDYKLVARSADLKNNRGTTPENWLKQHKLAYARHKPEIDTLRAFGMRRSELLGNSIKGQITKNGLTTNSFFRNDDGRLAVLNVAKGGHLYLSNVRSDMSDEMEKLYGKYAKPNIFYKMIDKQLGHDSKSPMSKNEEKILKKQLYQGKKLYEPKDLPKKIPSHLWRSDYSIHKLKDLATGPDGSKMRSINGYMATENQFRELSENLGHHRINVAYAYLR